MRNISFQTTVKGNTIEIPERFIQFVPRQVFVTLQADVGAENEAKKDSSLPPDEEALGFAHAFVEEHIGAFRELAK